ncbi:MAG: tetratricopeptide repeat protein [Thiobacillus sp.]|nr:tetratricopeptide repeat protein [Thiobacillus sp.]
MKRAGIVVALLFAAPALAEEAAQVFERVRGAVVTIETRDERGEPESQGSGVVIAPEQVVTNCHVIADADTIQATLLGKPFKASLLRRDAPRDLCLLGVPGLPTPPVPLRLRAELRVGEAVYAVGNPLGMELSVSAGLVSALPATGEPHIYTNTPLSPGSSGGGLFDATGRLVGITTGVFHYGQNFNLALPADWVRDLPQRGAPATPSLPTPGSEPDWIEAARKLLIAGDWPALSAFTQRWIDSYPSAAMAYVFRADAWANQGRPDEALNDARRATQLDPTLAIAQSSQVNLLQHLGRLAEARAMARRVITLTHEQDFYPWLLLGDAESRDNQLDAALAAYTRSMRIHPGNPEIWRRLGLTHAQQKQFDQAEHALRVALRLKPGDAEAQRALAQVQLQRGNQTGAADLLGERVAAEPESAAAWELLGHAEFQRNRIGEAEAAWRRALALDPKLAGVWASLGALQAKLGRSEDAETSLKQAVRLRPEQAEAWGNLAIVQTQQNHFADAETSWLEATRHAPDDAKAWAGLAQLRGRRLDFKGALEAYMQVVRLSPNNPDAWAALSHTQMQNRQRDAAKDSALRALTLNAKNASALHSMAIFHGQNGEFAQSLAYSERALAVEPGAPNFWSSKGYSLLRMGRTEDAVRAFETAIRLQPDFSNAWTNLGEARLKQGQIGPAIQSLQRALELAPRAVDTRLFLAEAFERSGQDNAAKLQLEQAVPLAPRHTGLLRRLIGVYARLGNSIGEAAAWKQLEKVDSVSARALRTERATSPLK